MAKPTLRYCADIGMHAYDRKISASCVHATDFCKAHCYNEKLFKVYPAMHARDDRNEEYWRDISGAVVARDLARKTKQTARVRLMTRGEAFATLADVARVESILVGNPGTLFWIPTRAWRSPILRLAIMQRIMPLPNARVLASMDPSNSFEDWEALQLDGWSTMSFGANDATVTPDGSARLFKCPKTWKGLKGHCSICKAGCFRDSQVHVHLKQH